MKIVFYILLVLALLCAGGYTYYHYIYEPDQKKISDERNAWESVRRYDNILICGGDIALIDSLESALVSYDNCYQGGGEHSGDVRRMLQSFQRQRRGWYEAVGAGTSDAVDEYIRMFPNGYYRILADARLDSLSYREAVALNTERAYKDYILSFEEGRYVDDAVRMLRRLAVVADSTGLGGSVRSDVTVHSSEEIIYSEICEDND